MRGEPRITVTGRGGVERAPDEAIVAFTVETDDADATRATSANNTVYNRLMERLRGLGLPASAVRTTSYNARYNPRPPRPNPDFPQRYGFVVSRGVTVTSDRTDRAGAIVDAAVAAGVSEVGAVTFGIKDRSAAYRSALAAAVNDAQAQARALADAAHVRLGPILAIAPLGSTPIREPLAVARANVPAAPPVPTDVEPSELTVRASVTVTYAIRS
jgi:uncharacterized protein YggE